ncbi:MAG: PAQR family membrane homeostasis protein TrhA [Clostridia bacterium]
MSIQEIKIPAYSVAEDRWNSATHAAGIVFGIAALIACLIRVIPTGDAWGIVSCIIYGLSLIVLYSCSAVYHGLRATSFTKKVMRVIDHCMIFILIAGTFAPYMLIALRPGYPAASWTLFAVAWACAILGIVLTVAGFEKFKVIQMILYIAIGWTTVFVIKPLLTVFSGELRPGFILLLLGGIVYTVGAIFYGLGKKIPYAHMVFHLFVVAGSVLHFISIYYYVLPLCL